MRILIIFYAAQMTDARATFRALAQLNGVQLVVGAPARTAVYTVYHPSGFLTLDGSCTVDGYKLVPLPLLDGVDYRNGYELGALSQIIDSTNPDVVHVMDEAFSVGVAQVSELVRRRRTPLLFYAFENMPLSWGIRSRIRYWKAWRGVTGGAAANSEAFKRLWAVGFPRRKPLRLIPWGIDTDLFKPANGDGIRAALPDPSARIVGYVGRFAPEKGIRILTEALKDLPDDVHGLLVGGGELMDELTQQATRGPLAGRLHILKPRDSGAMPEVYAAMDCVAVPSLQATHWKEQFGRVIAEAMACGVPVVGSSSGAIPEVIGDTGLIAREGDAKALAGALGVLLDDPEKRTAFGRLGREKAAAHYSGAAMARSFFDFYRDVAT